MGSRVGRIAAGKANVSSPGPRAHVQREYFDIASRKFSMVCQFSVESGLTQCDLTNPVATAACCCALFLQPVTTLNALSTTWQRYVPVPLR